MNARDKYIHKIELAKELLEERMSTELRNEVEDYLEELEFNLNEYDKMIRRKTNNWELYIRHASELWKKEA